MCHVVETRRDERRAESGECIVCCYVRTIHRVRGCYSVGQLTGVTDTELHALEPHSYYCTVLAKTDRG